MYSDREIRLILNRALELQQRIDGATMLAEPETKLSLEDIQEIARDSGLSTEYVRQAAMEYEGIPVEEPLFLDTGDDHRVELLGFANGGLDQKTWAELRALIEYHFNSPGLVSRRPNGISWKADPKGISKYLKTQQSPMVEVKSSGKYSSIRFSQDLKTYNKLKYPGYAALAAAALFFSIMITENPNEVLTIFFALAFFLGMAKLFFAWSKRKKQKAKEQMKKTMEKLQSIITRRSFTAEAGRKQMDSELSKTLN